jgi:ribosome hibernation promoting factor
MMGNARTKAMNIQVSGKRIEIGEALRGKVRARLPAALGKYFDGGMEAHVVFSRERVMYRADCTLHLDTGSVLKSEGEADDAMHAFETALAHLEKQVRRHMRRLKSHHG